MFNDRCGREFHAEDDLGRNDSEVKRKELLPYVSIETHNFSMIHLEKLDALVEHIQKFMIDNNFNAFCINDNEKHHQQEIEERYGASESDLDGDGIISGQNVELDIYPTFVEEVKPISCSMNQRIAEMREMQEWRLEDHPRYENVKSFNPSFRIHTFETKLENPNIAKHYFNAFGSSLFKPGEVLSPRLADALDMEYADDIPPYVENMKRVGYPPSYQGFEGKCFIDSLELKFEGNIQDQQGGFSVIPPDRKYIGYFGLNIAPPYEADTHRKWVYYDKSNDSSLIGRFAQNSKSNQHKFLNYMSLRDHLPTHRHNFDAPYGGFINNDYNENDIIMND